MSDFLLEPLRFIVLAGLGFFLFRTLQVMAADMRAALPSREGPVRASLPGEPHLVVEEGTASVPPGQSFPIEGEMIIGRSPAAHLVLADKFVSLRHARLAPRDGTLWATDLGSRNGTFVNDQRVVGSVRVGPEDRLRIGRISLRLRWPGA